VGHYGLAKRAKNTEQKTVQVGSKVVCVDDKFPKELAQFYWRLPIEGPTYTIREMGVGVSINGEPGEVYVLLEGVENPRSNQPPYPERGFNAERFRELEPPATEEAEAEAPAYADA
jgi:hypothetical protein